MWNKVHIAVQVKFELEIHSTCHTVPIRFCSKFLVTVKMALRKLQHGIFEF